LASRSVFPLLALAVFLGAAFFAVLADFAGFVVFSAAFLAGFVAVLAVFLAGLLLAFFAGLDRLALPSLTSLAYPLSIGLATLNR
jgi:hypothetical protein